MELLQPSRIQRILTLQQETYNVNLMVSNENGTSSKTASITVTKHGSSSGGSSGGGAAVPLNLQKMLR